MPISPQSSEFRSRSNESSSSSNKREIPALTTSNDTDSRSNDKGIRTRIACDGCRRKRIKCSGAPGPCVACIQHSTFCHFRPQVASKGLDFAKYNEMSEERSILSALLFAFRVNSEQEIRVLLDTLRSPDASALDMARALHHQLCLVRDRGGPLQIDFSENDILSLAIFDAAKHPTWSGGHTVDEHSSLEQGGALSSHTSTSQLSSHIDGITPTDVASARSATLPQRMWYDDQSDVALTEYANFDYEMTLGHTTSPPTTQVYGQDSQWSGIPSWSEVDAQSRTLPLKTSTGFMPEIATDDIDAQILQNLNIIDHLSAKNRDQNLAFDIPLSPPISDFSRLCAYLKDSGRQMLARGLTLQTLGPPGPLRCDLLFRDRTPRDAIDIPNWACEVARRLPPLCPATRIALALCIARVMPYLLLPCQLTWNLLPEALRPTEHQLQTQHDITINFIPIPVLRSLLVQHPVDWLASASHHRLRMAWAGSWGDIEESSLTEVGNWRFPYQLSRIRKRGTNHAVSSHSSVETLAPAILLDSSSGQRFVSEDFERSCWMSENWCFQKSISTVLPQLDGHIKLV